MTTQLTYGVRSVNLGSALTRERVAFLLELAVAKPTDARGVGDLEFDEAEEPPRILSGGVPLMAATVGSPLIKVASFSYGVRAAFSARKKPATGRRSR